ncbi:DUF4350 domain-containing protein [Microbacterium sp. 67-17]|uniref:DUF4350 domain-containing protein n=1 Tax=Microbacterium sp. 67-17 TaxID=1895782 RepID=UPI000B0A4B8F|nr:DUF4350 domain-containing protein [Microbacterium sp. 67-17]
MSVDLGGHRGAKTVAPTTSTRRGSAVGWIAIVAGLIAVGIVGASIVGGSEWNQRESLDPESAAPTGTRALARILADQGVDVRIVRSHEQAAAALRETAATLVLPDAPALSDEAISALTAPATDVVLIDPRSRTLRLIADGANAVGVADDALVQPQCSVPEARRAGAIRPRTVFVGTDAAQCYPAAGGYALLVRETIRPDAPGTQRVSAVDGAALFTNEHLAQDGNAALALGLMGRNATLVWYVPSVGDTNLDPVNPSLGELTPPWVSPVIVLALAAAVAAALWRGIRFGPLVGERLPVTVRGEETTRGRAHLYARSGDTAHAASLLRHGARVRIARLLGLSGSSSATEVADALARASVSSREDARNILDGAPPTSRRDLDKLYDRLRRLEAAARAALHPERNAP